MVHAHPQTKYVPCEIECHYIIESSMATQCTHVGQCPEDEILESLIRLAKRRVNSTITEEDIWKRVRKLFHGPDDDPEFQKDLVFRLKSALGYECITVN